jgi:uncharacterized glyoxalase superfamily protein PhnB
MPDCTVIPELVVEDVARAAAWLCRAFGFTERWRAGGHRVQLAVGAGAVALTEQRLGQGFAAPDDAAFRIPRPREVNPPVMVRVEDVDRHHERARRHRARILQPPETYPYGERQYTAEDPDGHRWSFSQTVADVAPEDWGGTSTRQAAR